MTEGVEGEELDEAGRTRFSLKAIFLGLAALLVATGLLLRWTAPEPELVSAETSQGIAVETLQLSLQPLVGRAELSGLIEARRAVEIYAENDGRVLEVGAEELDRVEADQLLFRLDPLQAEAALARAQAAVARSESELDLARTELARQRSLADRSVASESVLDQAGNRERVARAALNEARAALRNADDQLAKKILRAPFGGVLREFPVETGEYVQRGQRIAELLEVSRVRITVGLSDRDVVAVSADAEAEVRVAALPGERFQGRVLRVGAAADARTKKFPVQVEVGNPEGRLLPGMVARVELDLGEPAERLLLPRDATLDEFGQRFVYVVESADSDREPDALVARHRRIQVRRLPFRPADFEVTAGLEAGEVIAVTALRQLSDGVEVRPHGGETR
jgi:membrane fusion protein (multidrug efflux system)